MEHDELTDLRDLGWADAGNSTLWECWLRGRRYVFKEYADDFCAEADRDALGRLIAWRDGLADVEREYLDRVAAWPRYRVRRAGLLQGLLLPFAPAEFFHQRPPEGRRRPHILASLIRLRIGKQVVPGAPPKVKRHALGHAAEVLLWLHDRGVRVNDLREANILCTPDGQAVHYVDCDVMMGPWGAVGPVAAPEFLAAVLPHAARPARPDELPTREAELARLAWVAMWILLDDFAPRTMSAGRLAAVVDAEDADLLVRSGEGRGDAESWRRLAQRWTARWTGTAPVPRPRDEPPATVTVPVQAPAGPSTEPPARVGARVPAPTRPMVVARRPRRSHEWMPERYRKEPPPQAPPALVAQPADGPARPGRGLLLAMSVGVVALVLIGALLTLANGG